MNLQDLRNMNTKDAIQAAADFAGISPATIDGQWKQESNRGTHPTMISSAGAKGQFQALDSVHATWEQRLGTKLDRFNFSDSLYEYAHHMKENMQRYKNEDDAILAYHGGTNKANWGPITKDYLSKVKGGAAASTPVAGGLPTPAQPRMPLEDLWNATAADLKNLYPAAATTKLKHPAVPNTTAGLNRPELVVESANAAAAKVQARGELVRDTPVFGEGLYDANSKLGSTYLEEMRPYFRAMEKAGRGSIPVDTAWVANLSANSLALTKDFEHDDREELLATRNKGEYDNAVFNIQERTRAEEMRTRSGTMGGFGLALAGGLLNPVNAVAGLGATKALAVAGYGSVALAAQGRVGAAILSQGVEGAVGNVATTAVLDAIGEHKSVSDYGLDAATGMLGQSLLAGVPTYRAAMRGQADIIYKHALEEQGRVFRQAQKELGFDAPQEALIARAREIESQQVVKEVQATTAPAKAGDRMDAPNLDEATFEVEAPAAPVAEKAPEVVTEVPAQRLIAEAAKGNTPEAPIAPVAPEAATPAAPVAKVDTLPKELSGAKPRFGYQGRNTELAFASDIDKAAYIIAQKKPSKSDAAYAEWLESTTGMTREQAVEHGQLIREDIKARAANPEFDGKVPSFFGEEVDLPGASLEGAKTPTSHIVLNTGLRAYDPKLTMASIEAMPNGLHLAPSVAADPSFIHMQKSIAPLISEFLPNSRVVLVNAIGTVEGKHMPLAGNTSLIAVRKGMNQLETLVHELGHKIDNTYFANTPEAIRKGVMDAFQDWTKLYHEKGAAPKANLARSPLNRAEQHAFNNATSMIDDMITAGGAQGKAYAAYIGNFKEFMAEQFSKYIEAGASGQGPAADIKFAAQVVKLLSAATRRLVELFTAAKKEGLLRADTRVEAFFEHVRSSNKAGAQTDMAASNMAAPAKPRTTNQTAIENGLDLMPQGNPREKAEYKWAIDIFNTAKGWANLNPLDVAKTKILGQNNFMNFATPGTILALSPHPVARMIAGTLLEQTTGAAGRRKTAAIAKYMHEQEYVGNAIVDYDRAYELWRGQNGGGRIDDIMTAEVRGRFDKEVMRYREGFNQGLNNPVHPQVKLAAEALSAAYTRMNNSQKAAKTVGWARLPASSEGYTPHNLAARRLQDSTPEELRIFERIISDQTQDIEGWDAKFSENFAKVYLQHARTNANGGHEIPMNVNNPAAADMVRGALQAMGMNKDEVLAAMGRFSAGGPSHTKKRLHLDLNTEYPGVNGTTVTLLDLFNTNQLELLRNQARRVSGEVALAGHGVMGSQGLTLLRRALEFGPAGSTAERNRMIGAFDQVAAEFLGRPYGTALGKFGESVLTLNSVAKLGGMGIPQLGEYSNSVWSLGIGHTLSAIASAPRLRQELAAISRGEKVPNSIIGSLEPRGGGGEFGAEGFKMVTAFDSPERAYASVGTDAVTWFDRALRNTSHALSILSMHRMIQAVQVRGMAEEITLKAIRFITEGGESKALADMGFTPEIAARLKADMPSMVVRGANGAVKEFDITKATDLDAAQSFIQAVHRGSKQIIQGSFIGEQGKWVHEGHMKLFTQFKNYPLLAMEKQWGRQKGMHGAMGAVGIMLGSMAMVLPLVYARTALNAVGRPDREKYLDDNTTPLALAKASMNYIGVVGMAPDLLEVLQGAVSPALEKAGIVAPPESGSGRGGVGGKGIVSRLVPAVGFIDDAYQGVTQLDAHKAIKALPLSNLPYLNPVLNMLRQSK